MQSVLMRICGTALIGIGMSMLLLAMCGPKMPVITGMALVALGATESMLARYRRTPAIVPILILHTVAYSGLYALFIGAVLAADIKAPPSGLEVETIVDLAASTVPVAAAARQIWVGIGLQLFSQR